MLVAPTRQKYHHCIMTGTSGSNSFKLESKDWKNIFTVDLKGNSVAAQTKMTAYDKAVKAHTKSLSDVSGTFHGILNGISGEYVNQRDNGTYLPMIKNPVVVDQDGTKDTISSAASTLSDLHSAVRASIEDIRADMSTADTAFTGADGTMPAFGSALDDYNVAKQYNDVAKQQYAQQTENHVISLATNVAIFAGAVGVVYLAVNGRQH